MFFTMVMEQRWIFGVLGIWSKPAKLWIFLRTSGNLVTKSAMNRVNLLHSKFWILWLTACRFCMCVFFLSSSLFVICRDLLLCLCYKYILIVRTFLWVQVSLENESSGNRNILWGSVWTTTRKSIEFQMLWIPLCCPTDSWEDISQSSRHIQHGDIPLSLRSFGVSPSFLKIAVSLYSLWIPRRSCHPALSKSSDDCTRAVRTSIIVWSGIIGGVKSGDSMRSIYWSAFIWRLEGSNCDRIPVRGTREETTGIG